nr:PREDICTED: transmembrane protein C16orf54 homolog [Anolis carolinensis]|eukprot:XP_016853326.1 PREDICTED: transmembrane protein C16orf54 homolog [Anolis carolinensis]
MVGPRHPADDTIGAPDPALVWSSSALVPRTDVVMPPPSDASLLSDCDNCLLAMTCLALVAGVFMVISAILCERVLRGYLPHNSKPVPSVWRQGGTLWIEPRRNQAEPDVLSRQSETVPLWIQRSNDWFLDVSPELRHCDSLVDLSQEASTPSTSSPLWDQNEPTWGVQPRVTLQDLAGFFRHSQRGT